MAGKRGGLRTSVYQICGDTSIFALEEILLTATQPLLQQLFFIAKRGICLC
jgi:hypothetical protein